MELAFAADDGALHNREWRKRRKLVDSGSADKDRDCARHTAVVGHSQRSMTPEDKVECGRDGVKKMPGNSSRLKVG